MLVLFLHLEVLDEVRGADLDEDLLGLAEQLGAVGAAVARDGVDERLAAHEVQVHTADRRHDLTRPAKWDESQFILALLLTTAAGLPGSEGKLGWPPHCLERGGKKVIQLITKIDQP